MSDARLRELERRAQTDPAAEARLINERLRVGTLPRAFVRLAAHLGHPPAQEVIGDAPYQLPCRCAGTSSYCYSCKGAGLVSVDSGLVAAVRATCPQEIPLSIVCKWACGCVNRMADVTPSYAGLVNRIVPHVSRWAEEGAVTAELGQLQNDARGQSLGVTDFYVAACRELVTGTASFYEEGRAASSFAHAVSFAYHATGHSRAERNWQIKHLIDCLLA